MKQVKCPNCHRVFKREKWLIQHLAARRCDRKPTVWKEPAPGYTGAAHKEEG